MNPSFLPLTDENPAQQEEVPVFDDSIENMFSDHLLEIEQILQPPETQYELNEALDEDMLYFMQNMDSPAHENTQIQQTAHPELHSQLTEQETEPLPVQKQKSPDPSVAGELQTTKAAPMPSQQLSQLEPQVQEATTAQSQVQQPSEPGQEQQQKFQPDPFTIQNELLLETLQLRKRVDELRSQLAEAKKVSQKTKKSTPSLRLRMRLQPNARQTQDVKKGSVQPQLGVLQPKPQQIEPILVKGASSNPLADLFGHPAIPVPGLISQAFETQVQSEQAPEEDDSNLHLPFWKVGNPSHAPPYYFRPEEANASDLLEVLNTNLLAHENNQMDPKKSRGTSRSKKAGKKNGGGKATLNAIARPSNVPQSLMFSSADMTGMRFQEIPPNLPSNEAGQQKTPGRRNMQPNEREPRKRARMDLFSDGINSDSDSDEDEKDRSDPDYTPGEEKENSEELSDHSFASDRPEMVKSTQQNFMETSSAPDPSEESSKEVLNFEAFEPGLVTCPKCKDVFANSDSLERHLRLVHSRPKGKTHICKECQQVCRSKQNLGRHWSNAHDGELKFTCDKCGARFCTKRSLSLHRTKQHPDAYKPLSKRKKNKFHECQLCDYTSDQSYNVVRHVFTKHTDQVAAECLHGCGRTFKSQSNAKVHFSKCKLRPSSS